MTKDQLTEELTHLAVQYQNNGIAVKCRYITANSPVRIGDVAEDFLGRIKVETIGRYESFGKLGCTYTGPQLKADGAPYKNGKTRTVYQLNLLPQQSTPTIGTHGENK